MRCSLAVPRIKQFCFQPPEETLTRSIVGRTPFTPHRTNQLRIVNLREPARPALMGAAVKVSDGPIITVGHSLNCSIQHRIHQVGVWICTNSPADHRSSRSWVRDTPFIQGCGTP